MSPLLSKWTITCDLNPFKGRLRDLLGLSFDVVWIDMWSDLLAQVIGESNHPTDDFSDYGVAFTARGGEVMLRIENDSPSDEDTSVYIDEVANCNRNANLFWNCQLKMQRLWRIAPEKR